MIVKRNYYSNYKKD